LIHDLDASSAGYDANPYRIAQTAHPMQGIAPLARLEITTARLRLVAGDADLAPAVCEFQRRNRRHFAPWDPPTADSFYTLEAQSLRVQMGLAAFHADTAYRYWMIDATRAGGARLPWSDVDVIGSVHFSQVSRGAFQSVMLGYALDESHVGRGLMTEAVAAGIEEMFSPRVNLHRVQAAYRPENIRSGRVLERLGFHGEGLAPDYLYIDGAWRDHRVVSLRNPSFARPDSW
jgi:ribosomal-protein-alanine N-acetyltransferase